MNPYRLPVYEQREKDTCRAGRQSGHRRGKPDGSGKTTQMPLILHEAGYTGKASSASPSRDA